MQIIRFISDDEKVYTGCRYEDGSAALIKGDIFTNFEVSDRRKPVNRLLSPIDPAVIYCIGLNYMPHIKETKLRLPEYPIVFMKNLGAAAAHLDDVVIPVCCENPPQVDYEAELGVIIKKKVKNVSVENALDAVLGYTCANDISARQWQKTGGGKQWVKGKSFDTFCPFGPWMVTADEIINPQELDVECVLNGQTMQTGNTKEMLFSVAEMISFLSQSATLFPGTLILTGTPSGVGFTREPPVFLSAGDILETRISKIGTLKNQVVLEREQTP